jgi:hypothetical protein
MIDSDEFHNSEISSYHLSKGGVLHNPINDKRTTKGVFHVADYGLPIPADKIARLLKAAFQPPKDLNTFGNVQRNLWCPCSPDPLHVPRFQARSQRSVSRFASLFLEAVWPISTLSNPSLGMPEIPVYPKTMLDWMWIIGLVLLAVSSWRPIDLVVIASFCWNRRQKISILHIQYLIEFQISIEENELMLHVIRLSVHHQ